MGKRVKKPAVKPDVSKQWLRRFEEGGESVSEIAKADGYDSRTVRKLIEVARQEREAREARFMVLRQALESHYADLVSYAKDLDTSVTSASLPVGARDSRLWRALREHMPRSPLWKAIDKMERLNNDIVAVEARAVQRLHERVPEKSAWGFAATAGEPGLNMSVLAVAVGYHLKSDSEQLLQFRTRDVLAGLTEVVYGAFPCAGVPTEMAPAVTKFIADLMTDVIRWPEREETKRKLADRSRVVQGISEELATIIMRRVVPGRCKYCPI